MAAYAIRSPKADTDDLNLSFHRHTTDAHDFAAGGKNRPKGDAGKLVIRLRFGLIQVPVLQYTDINQISSKLYYDSCWRNFM